MEIKTDALYRGTYFLPYPIWINIKGGIENIRKELVLAGFKNCKNKVLGKLISLQL